MKRNFKRVMSLLLTVLMVLTAVPFATFAAEECEHVYTYNYYKNDKHIQECSKCGAADIVSCNGGTATCKDKAVCKDCNTAYGELSATHGATTLVIDDDHLKTAANCKSAAVYYKVCTVCMQNTKETELVGFANPDAHDYVNAEANTDELAGTHRASCSLCEKTFEAIACYDAEPDVNEPTCTEEGNTVHVCDVCNYEWETDTVDANGHNYEEESTVLKDAATCTSKATYWYGCTECDANAKDDENAADRYYEYGEMEPHNFTATEAEERYIVSAATCQEKAVYYKSCVVCGLSSEGTDDEATFDGELGTHSMSDYVFNNDAKCGIDGTETSRCTVDGCNEAITRTKEGSALQHSFTQEIADADHLKDAATCTTKATYWKECSHEGCAVKASDATVAGNYFESGDFAEHVWDDGTEKTPATCMTAGEMFYTCTTCPEGTEAATKTEPIAINPDAHTWSEWAETAEDKHERVCAHNNVHKETEDCGGGEATCTAKAECSVCGDEYGEIAPHAYTQKITDEAHKISAATCIAKATYWYDCENCDANAKLADKAGMTEEAIAALKYEDGDFAAHNYTKKCEDEAHIAKEATCTTDAFYWFGCAQEGCTANAKDDAEAKDKFYRAENTKTGHKTVTVEGKEPTCEEKGYSESIKCEKCGEFTKEAVERPAKGHKEVIVKEKVEATCERDGRTEEKECGVCGKKLASSKVIPALGHINKNGDDICDRLSCQAVVDGGIQECNCICHQSGFMRVLYIFVKLFWKLFGTSPICDCGIAHY